MALADVVVMQLLTTGTPTIPGPLLVGEGDLQFAVFHSQSSLGQALGAVPSISTLLQEYAVAVGTHACIAAIADGLAVFLGDQSVSHVLAQLAQTSQHLVLQNDGAHGGDEVEVAFIHNRLIGANQLHGQHIRGGQSIVGPVGTAQSEGSADLVVVVDHVTVVTGSMELVHKADQDSGGLQVVSGSGDDDGVCFTHELLDEVEVIGAVLMDAAEVPVALQVVDHTGLTTGTAANLSLLQTDEAALGAALHLDGLERFLHQNFGVAVFSAAADTQHFHSTSPFHSLGLYMTRKPVGFCVMLFVGRPERMLKTSYLRPTRTSSRGLPAAMRYLSSISLTCFPLNMKIRIRLITPMTAVTVKAM